jgi:hypothetical protein
MATILLIGVHGGYHFENAVIDAANASGRDVSLLVPFDTPVAVTVQSSFFKLQDGAGNAIVKGAQLPITASSAAPTANIAIRPGKIVR